MSAINKVPDAVLQTVIFPALSEKDLALSVKKIEKRWKRLVESSDPLVARLLQAKLTVELAAEERSKRVFSFLEARSWSTPRDDEGWSTY